MKKNNMLKLYFVTSFSFVLLVTFTPFYIAEMQLKDSKVGALKKDELDLVDFQNHLLGERFRFVLGDLHYLHRTYGENLSLNENTNNITNDWIEFANQRRIYDQIRFLNKYGDEVIRVNYDEMNGATLVDKSQLQNKADRYYFPKTKALYEESVFVSPLDLNIENDKIEEPFKPVIRFSTPLYDRNGAFQGIVILNYLGNAVLDTFRELANNSNGSIALLNSDSYWLSCEDSNNEWNFMFDDKQDDTFAKLYPNEWDKVTQGSDQIITDNGLFTFAPVHLNHNYSKGDSYQIDEHINYESSKWYIVSVIDNKNELAPYFSNNSLAIIKDIYNKNSLQLLLMFSVSIVVALLVYLNRKRYTSVA